MKTPLATFTAAPPLLPSPPPSNPWRVFRLGPRFFRLELRKNPNVVRWIRPDAETPDGLRCGCGSTSTSERVCSHILSLGPLDEGDLTRPLAVVDPPDFDWLPSEGGREYQAALKRDQNDLANEREWGEPEEAADASAL